MEATELNEGNLINRRKYFVNEGNVVKEVTDINIL